MGNENTRKKKLLTQERAKFTIAATLTFKRQGAKQTFSEVFGNFFEALTIFSQFFS